MTLFVDCNNSDYSLIQTGNPPHENVLYAMDREIFLKYFLNGSSFNSVIFKNLPEVGDGFILFKEKDSGFVVHVRCTLQNNQSSSLFKRNVYLPSTSSFLPESTKNKAKRIFGLFNVKITETTIFKTISRSKITKLILKMDSDLSLNRFKFGVAYLDRFDTIEQQMLANTIEDSQTSSSFTNFLNNLGDKINLSGWTRFSGGLDVSEENLTGKFAIYNNFQDSEIIFHVSPWLPQSESFESLQNNLERKRHFGNDTIVIIFSESLYAFEMQSLISRQIQIVIFVRFINRIHKYQIHAYSKIPNLAVNSNPFYVETLEDFENFIRFLVSLERQIYNLAPFDEKLLCMRSFHLRQITQ